MINIKNTLFCIALMCSALCVCGVQVRDINLITRANKLSAEWKIGGKKVNVTIKAKKDCVISKADSGITAGGNPVFVWAEHEKGSNDNDIFAQMFFIDGTKIWNTGRLPINIFRGDQTSPKVVSSPDGGFFVVWQSDSAGENNINIWCQRFSQDGKAAWITPVPVCAFSGNQINPVITTDIDGSLLVAWEDYRRGNADIYGQRIEQDGSFTGPEDGAVIDESLGNQTSVRFKLDDKGQPVALSWKSKRKGFLQPVVVETDISKMPLPEPVTICYLLLIINYFLMRKAHVFR